RRVPAIALSTAPRGGLRRLERSLLVRRPPRSEIDVARELPVNKDVDPSISLSHALQVAERPQAVENLPATGLNSQSARGDRRRRSFSASRASIPRRRRSHTSASPVGPAPAMSTDVRNIGGEPLHRRFQSGELERNVPQASVSPALRQPIPES